MEITICPYCGEKQSVTGVLGDLVRCVSCTKPFEIGQKPKPQPTQTAVQTAPQTQHRPVNVDMEQTRFGSGLFMARFVEYSGYFLLFVATIAFLFSMTFKGAEFIEMLISAVSFALAGLNMALFGHVARATMKTADHTKIIAEILKQRGL